MKFGLLRYSLKESFINVIQDPNNSIPVLTEYGPGTYQAICTGDPSVIQEWVTIYIEPTTAVVPIPSGPNYACDGQTITLTASGAPTGYTYKWYVLKDEAAKKFFRENIAAFDLFNTNPELFNTYTTTTASVTGPGDYYLQTISGNGAYKSEIRKITIAPAFPDDLEASNNSPIEIDGVLTLAVGYAPAGTTYSWTGPAGFSSTGRNVARTNFSEAMAGVYTVNIATGSTCSFTSTTEVSVANCDIYIQSKDASDQETYTLERTPGVAGSFEPLTLSILPYTGTNTFDAYKVVWYYNGDPIEPAPTTKTIQVSKAGDYRAVLSLKLNPSTICETEVHIAGKPCNPPINSGVCGSVTVVPVPDGLSEGVQLAPGDEFTAGDYTVIVTEITSGSKAGWWGKGYVAMRLINDINAAKISVTFEDAVINECSELAAGRVLTEYDPNWGGVADVDLVIADALTVYEEVSNRLGDLFTIFTGTCSQILEIEEEIEKLKEAFEIDPTKESASNVSNAIDELELALLNLKQCANCTSSINGSNSMRIKGVQDCNSLFNTCIEKKAVFDQLTILNAEYIENYSCEKLTKILAKPCTESDKDNCVLGGEVRVNISPRFRTQILNCSVWLEDHQWILWTGHGSKMNDVPVGDNYDEEPISFNKAAEYNIENNLHTNYPNIGSRHAWYVWADQIARPKNNYWFAAAVDVTSWRAVGAADNWNLGFVVAEEEFVMREINKRLLQQNFANFGEYLINPGAKIKDNNGNPVNLVGPELEARMVEIEQIEVENYISQAKSVFEVKFGTNKNTCSVGSGPGRVLTPWECAIKGLNVVSDGSCAGCYFDRGISWFYGMSFKGDAYSNAMNDFLDGIEYRGRKRNSGENYDFLKIEHRIYIGQRMAYYLRQGLE